MTQEELYERALKRLQEAVDDLDAMSIYFQGRKDAQEIKTKAIKKLKKSYLCINGGKSPVKEKDMLKIKLPGVCIGEKRRADGRFQGRYTNENGTTFVYDTDYQTLCRKMIDIVSGKTQTNQTQETIAEFTQEWYNRYKEHEIKPITRRSYELALRLIRDEIGAVPIRSLTPARLQEFIFKVNDNNGNRTAQICLCVINQSFDRAVKLQKLKNNPAKCVELKKEKAKHIKAFTVEEQNLFMSAAKGTPYDFLFNLLLSTGLRIGEALALTTDDFDLERKEVTVNKNVVFMGTKRIVQDEPKTSSGVRVLPLSSKVIEMYRSMNFNGDIFPTLRQDTARTAMRRICEKINLHGFSLHSFRTTFATRHAEAGTPDKILQYYMGHSDITLTKNVYVKLQEGYLQQYSTKVDLLF